MSCAHTDLEKKLTASLSCPCCKAEPEKCTRCGLTLSAHTPDVIGGRPAWVCPPSPEAP